MSEAKSGSVLELPRISLRSSGLRTSSISWQSRRMGGAKRYPSISERVAMGIASLHPSYDRHTFAISRRDAPEVFHFDCPSENRGRREDRVRAAPAVSRAIAHKECAHEHTGSAEAARPSLRSGFTAYFVLSPVNGSFATVAAWKPPRDLTPAPRRQDHTTSPYASCAFVFAHSASTASHRNVRDDRDPPLICRETREVMPLICPTG